MFHIHDANPLQELAFPSVQIGDEAWREEDTFCGAGGGGMEVAHVVAGPAATRGSACQVPGGSHAGHGAQNADD